MLINFLGNLSAVPNYVRYFMFSQAMSENKK
jgi:hypothetical protein